MCAMGLKMNGNGARLDRGMGRTPHGSLRGGYPMKYSTRPQANVVIAFVENATVDAAVPSRRAGVVVRRQDALFFFISSAITLAIVYPYVRA